MREAKKTVNKITTYHYKDCVILITRILDPKQENSTLF
jgi:hypothetical protein